MPEVILPPTFVFLLGAFAPCFAAPSHRTCRRLVAGWFRCLGRRTVTAVAPAAGAVGQRHRSACRRFFARARRGLDAVGQVVFTPALARPPADRPLVVPVDDPLAREGGEAIAPATMHHEPPLSTAREPSRSFGHVRVALALWVPPPMGQARGFALPLPFRLRVGPKRGGQADAPSRRGAGQRPAAARAAHARAPRPTQLALARELLGPVATWAGDRPVSVVADSPAAAAHARAAGPPPQAGHARADAHGAGGVPAPPAGAPADPPPGAGSAPGCPPSAPGGTPRRATRRSAASSPATPAAAARTRRSPAPPRRSLPAASSKGRREDGRRGWRSAIENSPRASRTRSGRPARRAGGLPRRPASSTTWCRGGTPSGSSRGSPPPGRCAPGTGPRRPRPASTCRPPSGRSPGTGAFLRHRAHHGARTIARHPGPPQDSLPHNGGSRGLDKSRKL
jgi:hypothetical protein